MLATVKTMNKSEIVFWHSDSKNEKHSEEQVGEPETGLKAAGVNAVLSGFGWS